MRRSSGPLAVVVLLLVVILPLLYVLALGPLVWFYQRGYISESQVSFLERVYYPLELAASEVEPIGKLLGAYVSLWDTPQQVITYPAPQPPRPAAAASLQPYVPPVSSLESPPASGELPAVPDTP